SALSAHTSVPPVELPPPTLPSSFRFFLFFVTLPRPFLLTSFIFTFALLSARLCCLRTPGPARLPALSSRDRDGDSTFELTLWIVSSRLRLGRGLVELTDGVRELERDPLEGLWRPL